MLTKEEADALLSWYTQDSVLQGARKLIDKESYVELEEYLHMTCLFPLSQHSELPEFMKNQDGKPLFPTNLNPKKDLEKWQEAIEIGWRVVEERFELSHAEVHRSLARTQKQDWDAFMDSVEQRKKERGQD